MVNKERNWALTRLGSEPITGAIDNELDIDWYAVEAGAGQTLQAVLDGSDFARNNCKLYLCEQRGGDNQNPRLIKGGAQTLTIDQAGTYFVGVYADNWLPNGNTGYTLRLDEVNIAENGFSISSPSYNNGSTLKMGEGNQITLQLSQISNGIGNYWVELCCAWNGGTGYAKSDLKQVTLNGTTPTQLTFDNLAITSCQNGAFQSFVRVYKNWSYNSLIAESNRLNTQVTGNMINTINFQKQTGGKYIYSNNKEVIHNTDTADKNNPNGSTSLFSQSGLTTGTYTLMLTHRNETSYPVYLDVQFYDPYPTQESKIKFTKYGDDVAGGSQYQGKSWAGMSGYAGYFGSPIGRVRSQVIDDINHSIDLTIPSNGLSKLKYPENYFVGNNNIWLSTQYNNSKKQYPVLTHGQLLYTMLEFEVVSDTGITINIAAFDARETEFETRFNNYIPTENAPYKVEYTVKGVSELSPEVEAPMYFYIDNNSPLEQPQSVLIKNAFKPEGQITDWWKTNMNPQAEKWNAHINTESDILPLYYSDPANGMNWVFDTDRDYRDSSYLPPGYLETSTNGSSNNSIACNMGNYGVKTTYQMNVYNATDEPRTFVYRVDTVSNLFLAFDGIFYNTGTDTGNVKITKLFFSYIRILLKWFC